MRYSFLVFASLSLLLSSLLFSQTKTGVPHIDTAFKYLGTVEKTGNNDGTNVKKFLNYVGLPEGYAWCAAYVSYCIGKANVESPKIRSAAARAFKTKNAIKAGNVLLGTAKASKGDLVVFEKINSMQGHIGISLSSWDKGRGTTIEGNTSSNTKGNQREGDGVYIKNRKIVLTDYLGIKWFVPVTYKKK